MTLLGAGQFTYEVSGENWGNLPAVWMYREATALAVDSHDNVVIFNRGSHPVIVLDSDGNVLRSWARASSSILTVWLWVLTTRSTVSTSATIPSASSLWERYFY